MTKKLLNSTALLVLCCVFSSCLFMGCEGDDPTGDTDKEVVDGGGNNGGGDEGDGGDGGDEGDKPNPDLPFHADLANYTLAWSDEFNDTSLDRTAWNVQINGNGSGNNEMEYYREENISFGKAPSTGEDCLILTAKKENFGGAVATSGRINTQGKKAFKYGRIDGRICLPFTANGLWPAFWMMGDDIGSVGWPRCGEIDILEMGNSNGISAGTQDRYFNGACHWGPQAGGNPMYAKDATWSYPLQGDFHIWTLIWTPQVLKMYVDLDKYPDSEPYYEMGIAWEDNEWASGYYFNKPHHILFNLAVGGNFTGITGNDNIGQITALAAGEAQMYIDYVRVYQEK